MESVLVAIKEDRLHPGSPHWKTAAAWLTALTLVLRAGELVRIRRKDITIEGKSPLKVRVQLNQTKTAARDEVFAECTSPRCCDVWCTAHSLGKMNKGSRLVLLFGFTTSAQFVKAVKELYEMLGIDENFTANR